MDSENNQVLIVGGGQGGVAMLEMLLSENLVSVAGVVDQRPDAPGVSLAKSNDIATYAELDQAVDACGSCLIFNLTGDPDLTQHIQRKNHGGGIIGGAEALLMWRMVTRMHEMKCALEALSLVAIAITSSLGLQEVMEKIMHHGIELTGSKAACISFYNEDSKSFVEWFTQGLSDQFEKNMVFRPGGMAFEAFGTGLHIVSNDRPESRYKLSALAREEGILGFICLPLICKSQRLGLLYLYRHDRDTFSTEEISLLTTFSHLAAEALENARLHLKTVNMANTDALTGLLNRRLFDERLTSEMERSQRYSLSFCLLMLDVDHFKEINDTYGHLFGDTVLEKIAALLRTQTRKADIVARFGGEEFAIIAPESDTDGAKLEGERIRNAIAASSFVLPDGGEIRVTVSVGIAAYPLTATDTKMMIDQADKALYLAKDQGRNTVCAYPEQTA